MLKVISDLDDAKKAANRVRPDAVTYDGEGRILSEAFTKAKLEEHKKAQELIVKLETALNEALDETVPNFEKVLKMGGSGKPSAEEKE